jgi:UDP-N-acetylmuramoyl-tripeptide--D-alanyl-D-alanine ligase
MKALYDELKSGQQGGWAPESAALAPLLIDAVKAGDAVMVKGSLASRMGPIVEALQARFAKAGS